MRQPPALRRAPEFPDRQTGTVGCLSAPSWAMRLSRLPDVEFLWQEPLDRHTTFRVGGPVVCLARPRNEDALVRLLEEIRTFRIPCLLLGAGSNILPPDEPWDVLVLQLSRCCSQIHPLQGFGTDEMGFSVGAGVRVARWLRFCLQNGLGGQEILAGIPGTIGGALVMNAGTTEGCIAESLLWMDILDEDCRRRRILRNEVSPAYRSMGLPQEWIVLGGGFRTRSSPKSFVKARLTELVRRRKRTQPQGWPSAGCIFKNPPGASAGALIDRSGLKGMRFGDAQISEKHANWIVNRGKARARDILELIGYVEEKVHEAFGIRLEREIKVVGLRNGIVQP